MIRVAIIGAGIGREHLAAYQALPGRFDVLTLCDLDLARAREVAGDAQIAVTGDLAAVLADDRIDVVDICLPPHLHLDAALQVLAAGKHVICEKPLVPSLAAAEQLRAAQEQAGKRVFPVFQYRYGPGTDQLAALIEAGLAGKPLVASIETHWNRGDDYYAVDWRGTWAAELGGAVLGHAIHAHDLLQLFFGPVAEVSAFLETRVNPIEVDDCAAIAMRLESGALATSSVTLGSATEISRLRFCFSGLTAESGTEPYRPARGPWRFTARDPGRQAEVDQVVSDVPTRFEGFTGFFDAVADALDGRPGREVTFEDGRRSLEFVTALYKSARGAGPVALPIKPTDPLFDGWFPSRSAH